LKGEEATKDTIRKWVQAVSSGEKAVHLEMLVVVFVVVVGDG
jgi:cell division protein FtsL